MSETLTEPRTVTATRTVTTSEVIERMRLATVARVPAKPWRDTGRWLRTGRESRLLDACQECGHKRHESRPCSLCGATA